MSTPVKPKELARAKEYLNGLGADGLALDKYFDFITQTQPPSSWEGFPTRHKHHIVPRWMDERDEFKKQLAYLGIADHFRAHHLLFLSMPTNPKPVAILSFMLVITIPQLQEHRHRLDASFWFRFAENETSVRELAQIYEQRWIFEFLDKPKRIRREQWAKIDAKIEKLLG
jgi:hypothetical protein